MRTAVRLALLALTLTMGACGGGPPAEEFTKEDGQAIRRLNDDHIAAFNGKDIDKVIGLYSDDAVFMPPNAPLLRGQDPTRDYYRRIVERGATLKMEPEEVNGHGPLAYESGTYEIVYTDGEGSRDRGKYLRVLRKLNNNWRIVKMMWSSDLPKPAGN